MFICFNLQSFEKILNRVGIQTDSSYCLFLLETCKSQTKSDSILIDYKLFLNSAIKALSQENFDNEIFIIEHFWKSKFGDRSQQQVPIDSFNQAFYQFFNKDTKLLSIDYIEQVLNECFAYLLRKNKKSISKRNFRKVIKRYFKDIFSLIFFSFEQKAQTLPLNKRQRNLSGHLLQDNLENLIPRDENLGQYINTTYYPDSLDTRSNKQSKKLITNVSKSLNETSTFQNNNTRSKSTDLNYQKTQTC